MKARLLAKFAIWSALTAAVVVALVEGAARSPLAVALLGLGVNFATGGLMVLWGKLVPFPAVGNYYELRSGEAAVWERLGVRGFRQVVRWRWYRFLFGPAKERVDDSWERLLEDMRAAETAHLLAFAAGAALALSLGANGSPGLAWSVALWNVPLNAYPVLLQRYNRSRVRGLLGRRQPEPAA